MATGPSNVQDKGTDYDQDPTENNARVSFIFLNNSLLYDIFKFFQ